MRGYVSLCILLVPRLRSRRCIVHSAQALDVGVARSGAASLGTPETTICFFCLLCSESPLSARIETVGWMLPIMQVQNIIEPRLGMMSTNGRSVYAGSVLPLSSIGQRKLANPSREGYLHFRQTGLRNNHAGKVVRVLHGGLGGRQGGGEERG